MNVQVRKEKTTPRAKNVCSLKTELQDRDKIIIKFAQMTREAAVGWQILAADDLLMSVLSTLNCFL